MSSSAFKSAMGYANAAKFSGFLAKKKDGIFSKAKEWLNRKPKVKGSCGCFAAATMVWTANGAVPIVDIEEGQQVLAAPDDGLAESYASNEVGTKIIVGEASLVQLVLLHEDGSSEVLNTTDEHPFHVADTAAWTRADQLIIGDELSTITGTAKLQSVLYTTERVPVYNLSIPGSPTYYVGEHGVWVHNCGGEFSDNLTESVVNKSYHNWQKMFGGRMPSLDEVRPMIMDVAENGVPVPNSLQTHASGFSHVFEGVKDGFVVWAEVFYKSDTGESLVRSGGVR